MTGCGWLLLPLAAVAATPGGDDTVVVAAPAPPPRGSVDIFAVRTWEPAAPPPAADSKPPRPQAPPLPFKFLGRIDEPGKAAAFMLEHGERILVVGVGDAVGGNYRVEKYEKGKLLFRYLPMNVRQTLDVGNPL